MSAVHRLQPSLRRVIVVRQVSDEKWAVHGYERHNGCWRYTWTLHSPTTLRRAHDAARDLSRSMGLPVAEQADGERLRMCPAETLG